MRLRSRTVGLGVVAAVSGSAQPRYGTCYAARLCGSVVNDGEDPRYSHFFLFIFIFYELSVQLCVK